MTPTPQEAREALAKVKYSLNAEDVSPNSERIKLIRAYITASEARVEELEAEVAKRDETIRAWRFVFSGLEAHLQDRINMRDPASPETYLSIIRSSVANVDRDSQSFLNATMAREQWHRTQLAERDALLAEAGEVLGVLDDLKRYPSYMYEDSDGAYDTVLRVGDLRKAASVAQKIREVKP